MLLRLELERVEVKVIDPGGVQLFDEIFVKCGRGEIVLFVCSVMFGPLVDHECAVVIIYSAQYRCWLLQNFFNLGDHFSKPILAPEEPLTLCLIKHSLRVVFRQIDICFRNPLANLFAIWALDIEIAEYLSGLHDGHQMLLGLLRQVCTLVVATINKLLLQLCIC